MDDDTRFYGKSRLIGKPEEIIRRIEELQAFGVGYIMLTDLALSRDALRTFVAK